MANEIELPKDTPNPGHVKKIDIVQAAAKIVTGARQSTHGDATENHKKIAAVWNGILIAAGATPARPLNAHDVANLMEGLKIARRYLGDFNVDDYIDGVGYAAVAGEIASKQEQVTSSWAQAAFDGIISGGKT